MSGKLLAMAICLAVASACSSTAGVPRHIAVPEGAQNPIVLRYSGATVEQMTNVVAQMCANVPISTAQVVPANGYVETRWSDLADFNLGSQVSTLPPSERFVVYAFQVKGISENEGVLQIGGWYQPTAPAGRARSRDSRYDRLFKTGHPGYQMILQFDWRLRNNLFPERGITVVEQEQEGQ
jgi:hypothetical protein